MNSLSKEIDLLLEYSLVEAPTRMGALNTAEFTRFDSKEKIDREKEQERHAKAYADTKKKEADAAAKSGKEKEDKEASDRRKEARAKVRAQYRATSVQRVRNNPNQKNCGDYVEYRTDQLVKRSKYQYRVALQQAKDEAVDKYGCKGIANENKQSTGELVPIVIDLEELKSNKLNESFLSMFGGWVEHLLGAMFGVRVPDVKVTGSRRDVESFAKTLAGEKNYIEAVKRYGLDHPTTYKNKAKLATSIKGFERDTGLKWPFE